MKWRPRLRVRVSQTIPGNQILLRPDPKAKPDLDYLREQIRGNQIDAVVVSRLLRVDKKVTHRSELDLCCPVSLLLLFLRLSGRSVSRCLRSGVHAGRHDGKRRDQRLRHQQAGRRPGVDRRQRLVQSKVSKEGRGWPGEISPEADGERWPITEELCHEIKRLVARLLSFSSQIRFHGGCLDVDEDMTRIADARESPRFLMTGRIILKCGTPQHLSQKVTAVDELLRQRIWRKAFGDVVYLAVSIDFFAATSWSLHC